MKAQNILMIQLRQLGDILLTTPCLRAVKENNPRHRITFLTHTMGREILKDSPYLDELITYNDKSMFEYGKLAFSSLRQHKFTMVFDFMANPRSAKFAWLTRSPQRYAFSTGRNWAFTHIIPRQIESDYIVREKFELLKAAGFAPKHEDLLMPWAEKDLGPYRELMENPDFAKAPFKVALSPTHRRENRRWPLSHYKELATRLVREKKAAVVWTWGPGERELVRDLVLSTPVPTFQSPQTSLRELTALLAQLDLFIGNANGASHFAVAANCPTLKLCGPHTEERAWSPLTERHRVVKVQDDIKNMSVDMVWKSVDGGNL